MEALLFEVYYDENQRYMDEDSRSRVGAYPTLEAAIAECRRIVEDDIREQYQARITPGALLSAWRMWGRDPFILGEEGSTFSAWRYAEEATARLLAEQSGDAPAPQSA
jgi:hypothetical protein